MGFLGKLFGGGGGGGVEDDYFDALIQLGELVSRRPPRGVRLRHAAAVAQIQRVVQARRTELQSIDGQMEAEERRIMEQAEAEAREKPDLEAMVRVSRAGILNLDRKVSSLRKQLVAKRANFKYFVKQLEAQEAKVQRLEDEGHFEQAEAEREQLKRVRLDHMRQESSLADIEEEIEAYLDGEGAAGEGMRAKIRLEEIQENEQNRDKVLKEILGELDKKAEELEGLVRDAEEQYEDALAALGEEVYAARLQDPQYEQVYAILDPLAAQLR
ncbi:MAG: hypothetical protein P1V51_10795 [Deltaproteobacteria bacterium]|nr:hypothetical protein [Deltaproteobacteria bacterium]